MGKGKGRGRGRGRGEADVVFTDSSASGSESEPEPEEPPKDQWKAMVFGEVDAEQVAARVGAKVRKKLAQ
jgi:hypothetical protein